MIDRILVFTRASLDAYLTTLDEKDPLSLHIPELARDLITAVPTARAHYVIHASDDRESPRVVFASRDCLSRIHEHNAALDALQRAGQLAIRSTRMPVRLPPAWSSYHSGNLVAFFAAPRPKNDAALRWVVQLHPQDSRDVYFCRVTTSAEPVNLERYRPHLNDYRIALEEWSDALAQATKRFRRRHVRAEDTQLAATVDLEAATFGAVVGNLTYRGWLERITADQRAFLEQPVDVSTKLRGPAGSGKTLMLELKALYESYRGQVEGKVPKILFVTHSWAMAEQVDAALLRLHDSDGMIDNISVVPLLSIAQELIPTGRGGAGFDLLGEDNFSGKRLQLDAIEEILEKVVASDWLVYEDRCTEEFARLATAEAGSTERRALAWDLMQEFACVLSAHGILPGVNAPRAYLPLQRMPWMMPLQSDGEKLFVLQVYSALVDQMRQAGYLTSDQLMNDFLNYLETFAWNLHRPADGFDLIFVDELHLFNEQERLALSFLSRDANTFPVMFMALDPRQSPSEVYTGTAAGSVVEVGSGEADAALGSVKALDLRTVHRFSPEILELVRLINNMYPALELGRDWHVDSAELYSSHSAGGPRPTITMHQSRAEELDAVGLDAMQRLAAVAPDERVAVILVDTLALEHYEGLAIKGVSLLRLRGRDDVDALQYSKRALVLSPAEYAAGLQFASILICGFPPATTRRANLGHERRRLLSLLYLAATRATRDVAIHVNMEDGGVPEVLEVAIQRGIVIER